MRGYRSGLVDLAGGQHALVVEYFEEEGAAMAHLNWVPVALRDSP